MNNISAALPQNSSFRALFQSLGKHSDLLLVAAVVGILLVLFMPIPAQLLDFLLLANLHFALLVLLITFYVDKPLQFSTFPSLLLIATLFRLALNIAATRLILNDADAGKVIESIGSYVVGGNYVIGLIVFIVLIVVQYVVVTNGAQRVAEVSARFTLDAMPGKQMSIDADLNMGLIDEKTAQDRRKQIEREANFYGAMDGASKFVKGDAIAGIIIILIDIIGGLAIGVAQRGMSWSEALETFTLLTIGDGIVTQIPALIISTGTGIIVTRAASDALLSKEIGHQVTAFPKILGLLGISALLLLVLPGIPFLPVVMLLLIVGSLYVFALKAKKNRDLDSAQSEEAESEDSGAENIYQLLTVDALQINVGQRLAALFAGDESLVMDRIGAFRKQYALEKGFVIPRVHAKDDKHLDDDAYEILIHGAKVGEGAILANRQLAINPGNIDVSLEGVPTKDPTYGMDAIWIEDSQSDEASNAGFTIVDPVNVLITHLSEVIRNHAAELLSRAETSRLIAVVKESDPNLLDELIPAIISMGGLQKVLKSLVEEGISIRRIDLILETLAEIGRQEKDTGILVEGVRRALGPTIIEPLVTESRELHVIILDAKVEQKLAKGARPGDSADIVVEPKFAEAVLTRTAKYSERMIQQNLNPSLLVAPEMRRYLRNFMSRMVADLNVISMAEVPQSVTVKPFGVVMADD